MSTSTKGSRARRVALVLAFATATVAAMHATASSGPEQRTKDGPVHLPEDASLPAPDGQTYPEMPAGTVPAHTTPLPDVACDGTWFDNPSMHYGLCVPDGWGFTDFAAGAPLAQIPVRMLPALHLVNARAFPWRVGDMPFDAVRERGVIDVELTLLEPGIGSDGECEPFQPRLVAGTTFLTCEQAYDKLGLPAPTGLLRATKIAVPLLQPPLGKPELAGSKLLVIARTTPTTPLREVDTLWRLVDSIRAS